MALIYFYDVSELDKEQLSNKMQGSGHRWEYVEEKISLENIDPEAEVISVFVSSTVTKEMIEAMPNLKLIACRSTGFNNIDLDTAGERDITIANVPAYGDETVAEYAFTMLLALMRKIPEVLLAEHTKFTAEDLKGRDLGGKTFGVIGAGRIGQKSLKIAKGFSMRTLAADAHPVHELQEELGFEYVSLDDLLAQSDFVSLHAPYLPSTHHIMNKENLRKMKKGAILINTARGELVDSNALIELLDNGHLGGACIDVVEGEPLLNHEEELSILLGRTNERGTMKHSVEISVLKSMPNVIISPHNAYNTVEAIARINDTSAQNILDYYNGELTNKVTPPKKPRGKLLIARHGESEWNKTGQWTGVTDVHLDEKGFKEAGKLGVALKELDMDIDIAFCSQQIRSRETLEGMLNASQMFDVEIITVGAINERDYGDYTGKNKWEVKEQVGEEKFNEIRRGWDVQIPNGETLKMVYQRVVPFYEETIMPLIKDGKNVLIVAHGNSIRAMMKHIECIPEADVCNLEMLFGQILVYETKKDGTLQDKQIIEIDTEKIIDE